MRFIHSVLQDEELKRLIQQAVGEKERELRERLEAERKALEEKLRRQEEERQRQEQARRAREEELRRDQLVREQLKRQGVCPMGYEWLKVRLVLCFMSRDNTCGVCPSEAACAEARWWLDLRGRQPLNGVTHGTAFSKFIRPPFFSKAFAACAVKLRQLCFFFFHLQLCCN